MRDDETPPESGSLRKLVVHIVDEMPWRVVAALGFVAFFFFFGMANSVVKLLGYDAAAIDFPLGPAFGGLMSIGVLATCIAIKTRRRP